MIGLMKDELDVKIMAEFVALRPKTHSYLIMMAAVIKKLKEQKSV